MTGTTTGSPRVLVTPWQPDSCTVTGGKLCSPAANTSRTEPADAAGQCCPGGMAGSAQRAATMACTWVAPWSVTWRGHADPLTTTRSAALAVRAERPARRRARAGHRLLG